MWFLLRAAFWLSIVYAAIFWPQDPLTGPSGITRKAQGLLGQTIATARAEAEKACLRAPGNCLERAMGLGSAFNDLRAGAGSAAPAPMNAAAPAKKP